MSHRNNSTHHGREKRQLGFGINNAAGLGSTFGGAFGGAMGGGLGGQMSGATLQAAGFGGLGKPALTFADYYANFLADAAYDYYDWVCTGASCQLCDVLTGDCCDPNYDRNCFLPDSCANNPCLSGGTCISTLTVDFRPDFVCVCQRCLTGKYCQLLDEYTQCFVPPPPAVAPVVPGAPAVPAATTAATTTLAPVATYQQAQPTYQQAQPTYQQAQTTYQQAQPAYQQAQTLQTQQVAQQVRPVSSFQSMSPQFQQITGTQTARKLSGTLQNAAKIQSLAATTFTGFQCGSACTSQGGTCKFVLSQSAKRTTETYCVCKTDNTFTYGTDCKNAYKSPCVVNMDFISADRSIPSNYFIECNTNGSPKARKCENDRIWNNNAKTCDKFTLHSKRLKNGANKHGVFMNGLTVN